MPKQMFYNIPKEKQLMIIEVATKEFTNKSFEEVSVSSIIKEAHIPRGSFYTYFEDLDDLFDLVFTNVKVERFKYAQNILEKSNRDFFVFIKELFIYDFDSFQSKHRYSLFRNYIHFIEFTKKGTLKKSVIEPLIEFGGKDTSFERIFNIDKYNMNINEFLDLIEMTMIIMINTFLKSESEGMNKEEVIALFNRRMSILEAGAISKAKTKETRT